MTSEALLAGLAEWMVRSTILAGFAWVLLYLLRIRDVTVRLNVWTLVVIGALVLPLVPRLSIPLPAPRPVVKTERVLPYAPGQTTAVETRLPPVALRDPAPTKRPIWPEIVAVLWFTGVVLLTTRLTLGLYLSWRLIRRSCEIGGGLHESGDVTVPLTAGMIRPVTLLPSDWRAWDEAKLAAILAHERAHVKRCDPIRKAAASLYRSVCWFHPLAWWLEKHISELAEAASDDAALRVSVTRSLYAEALLEFLGRAPQRVEWTGVSMATSGRATKRMERILDSSRELTLPLTRRTAAAIIAIGVPFVLAVASAQPSRRATGELVLRLPALPGFQVPATTAQSVSTTAPAADKQESLPVAIIVSDGTNDIIELRTPDGPGEWGSIVRIPDSDNSDTETHPGRAWGVYIRAALAAGVVKLELGAVREPFRPNSDEYFAAASRTLTEAPMGSYTLSTIRPLVVNAGVPYGLPPLHFRFANLPDSCEGDLNSISVTPSLRVERLARRIGNCGLLLRNTSSKWVLGLGLYRVTADGQRRTSQGMTYNPASIAPEAGPGKVLEVGAVSYPKPGQRGSLEPSGLGIQYCLFADGTYEGDAEAVKEPIASLAGQALQYEQFESYLRGLLALTSEEMSTEKIRGEIARLPLSDEMREASVLARLNPANPDAVRRSFRQGMSNARHELERNMHEYETWNRPVLARPPLREYLEFRGSRCAAYVSAVAQVLNGFSANN